jgi:hypothetical protein
MWAAIRAHEGRSRFCPAIFLLRGPSSERPALASKNDMYRKSAAAMRSWTCRRGIERRGGEPQASPFTSDCRIWYSPLRSTNTGIPPQECRAGRAVAGPRCRGELNARVLLRVILESGVSREYKVSLSAKHMDKHISLSTESSMSERAACSAFHLPFPVLSGECYRPHSACSSSTYLVHLPPLYLCQWQSQKPTRRQDQRPHRKFRLDVGIRLRCFQLHPRAEAYLSPRHTMHE